LSSFFGGLNISNSLTTFPLYAIAKNKTIKIEKFSYIWDIIGIWALGSSKEVGLGSLGYQKFHKLFSIFLDKDILSHLVMSNTIAILRLFPLLSL
jgi:hypothetical protein